MKKIFFLIAITSALISCGPAKPLTPEEQEVLNTKIAKYTKIFEEQSFVLEANTVYGKRGRSYIMNSTINFVKLDQGTGVLQLGFDQIVGWNGVGGITLDGRVRNYEVIKGTDKNKMPSVKFDMNGASVGWASVMITVNSSGMATAYVSGNFGERITFAGPLKDLKESSTYQGMTNY